jgi:hypothetical protein
VPRSQKNHEKRLIRFKRVVSAYAIQWFVFVKRDTDLTVNGQTYPKTRDFVIGPLPSFSIVEYHDRAVFLFLNSQSVDYTPGNLEYQSTVDRIVGNFSKQQELKKKDAAASTSGETVDIKPTVRIEPEILADDTDPCEYFRWRLQEWKLLRQQSGVTLHESVPPASSHSNAAWLWDNQIYRAIASVTTAIEVENNLGFAMIDEEGYRKSRQYSVDPRELVTTGHNGDLFLPYNTDTTSGMHWILVHVKYVDYLPEIHVYDTLNMVKGTEGLIKKTIVNTGLYDDHTGLTSDLDNVPLTHHAVARQPSGWECGYFTILNAWCVALGMKPGVKPHRAASAARVADLIDLINLATSGFMDSATIQAFMRCVGFVDPDHDIIAPNRHFTRSVPFLTRTAVNSYILERRELDKNPESAIRRLDPGTIHLLLDSANPGAFGDLEKLRPDIVLQHFDTWLKERKLVDPTTPPSPTSPATIRLTFGIAQSLGPAEWAIPSKIPDDTRVLRQIWEIYHALLKEMGYLGQARQERANDLSKGAFSTQEVPIDAHYPYLNPKIVTLARLGMLPTTHTLQPAERETLKSAAKPKLRLTAKKSD